MTRRGVGNGPQGPPLRPRTRAVWTLVDQVLVSVRNFVLLLVVIREFPVAVVGAFGIVYTTYFLAMALVRGLAGDPLIVRYTGASGDEIAAATAGSLGAALLVTGVLAPLMALPLAVSGQPLWVGLAALALSLPGLIAQDHMRLASFTRGRPDRASLNDTMVLVSMTVGLAVLGATEQMAMWLVVVVWGAAALVGTVVAVLTRDLPGFRGGRRWFREHSDIGPAFATDAVANRGTEQLTQVLVAAVAGIGTVGVMTASRTLFAPLTTVQTGVNAFVMPEVARRARDRRLEGVPQLVAVLAALLALAMLATGLVVALVPDEWGQALFSANWDAAAAIVWPMAVFSALNAVGFAYWAAMKALARARRTLMIRAIGGMFGVVFAFAGASQGAAGATWGMAAGAGVTAAWLAIDLHRSIGAERGPHVDASST